MPRKARTTQEQQQPKLKDYVAYIELPVKAESVKVVEKLCDALIFNHTNVDDYELSVTED